MKKVVVSFAIPEKIKEGLDKYCKKQKRSRSDLVSSLIWREIGDWKQEKLHIKNCHTFHIFCDSSTIAAILYGAEKNNCSPENYIKKCIVDVSYGVN